MTMTIASGGTLGPTLDATNGAGADFRGSTLAAATAGATDIAGTPVDPQRRPVTFAYNGGPGSASVPINFGGIGPRRVKTRGVSPVALTPDERTPGLHLQTAV